MIDLESIKARCEAATPGPWVTGINALIVDANGKALFFGPHGKSNAEFIAHARTDVTDLIAEVERLREALKGAQIIAEEAKGHIEENKRLRTERRWIPVSERLPEYRIYPPVICGHNKDCWTDAAIVNDAARFINSEGCEIYPTHWTPLPAPPEQEATHV